MATRLATIAVAAVRLATAKLLSPMYTVLHAGYAQIQKGKVEGVRCAVGGQI